MIAMADEKKQEPRKAKDEVPDSPSAKALAEVGNLDGEDVSPDDVAQANDHGEKYQAAKRKHRWG